MKPKKQDFELVCAGSAYLSAEMLREFCAIVRFNSTLFRPRAELLVMNPKQWLVFAKCENIELETKMPPENYHFDGKLVVFDEKFPDGEVLLSIGGKIRGRLFNLANG